MPKVTQIFQQKNRTCSFELFPPKTDQGYQKLLELIGQLAELKPDFISCTYGAGGGSRDKTFDIVEHIEKHHQITAVAHLTCVCHTKDEIRSILENIKSRGVQNVLALRGDPPKDNPDWKPGPDNFRYSSELCAFIRKHFDGHFGIGVAGFPEGHLLCRDQEKDADFLKMKTDAGADYVITQLFFKNQDYFDYVQRLKKRGVNARVLPGILPITDYGALLRFAEMCGATVTDEIKSTFAPIQEDKDKTLEAGITFAVKQCRELLAGGAPGLHFYCLNKLHPVADILKQVLSGKW
jgi:methylenetetrahydrofolate reductase (NADPH)